MESPPPLVVRSPRQQTRSLLRNPKREPQRHEANRLGTGPKPSEVYGFVGSITTVIATGVYLVWAYTPETCLHSMGITYYPTKYWALAVPTLAVVAVALSMLIYMGSNFLATPPPTSFSTIADDYSRERTVTNPITQQQEEAETPIEPISDIGIHRINDVMFAPDPTLYI
ncbi:hypothetical protein BRADI_1g78680v3 [Brachypodium distachyon]|uniref:PIG-P domain-containing protein n=1 Tax=Brachypodium distachyon TaxID=15368 RepID=I1HAY7_BRADI|nr:hypothetical protein BRADI_1g78680v3 [Brachypodium distachyon]